VNVTILPIGTSFPSRDRSSTGAQPLSGALTVYTNGIGADRQEATKNPAVDRGRPDPVGPNTLVVNERILAILRAAGLPDRTAAYVVDLMSLYIGAFAFEESLGLASPTGEDLPAEQVVEMIKGYFASLPPERFPNTLAIVDQLFAGDPDERFEFGLEVLVRGLAAASGRAAATSRTR
jgi:hypothetical protein